MNAVLIVDKPIGWTSFDVVKFIRKKFSVKKVGHAGTLDPMATGVLVVLLGSSTKLSGEFLNHNKQYSTSLTLGITTDTADSQGKVLKKYKVPKIGRAEVKKILKEFMGEVSQVPPMVSALKHNGERLYKLARRGIRVERKPRKITIHTIELTKLKLPEVSFEVSCSKGTYVRTLCEDIGKRMGCGGHMSYLKRLSSGSFHLDNALSIDTLQKFTHEDILRYQKDIKAY